MTNLASLGPWGLLILVVSTVLTAFVRGWLVSSTNHQAELNRLVVAWEARLLEAGRRELDWRTAFMASEQRGDVQAEQLGKLMAYAQATDQILRSLPRGAA